MEKVLLEISRLVIRDFVEEDWRAVHEYASDPETVRYLNWGPNTEEDTKNFLSRTIASQEEEPRRDYQLAIVLKSEEVLIGGCRIFVSSQEHREGWIGYILNRRFWGQGYATEAGRALLAFGFQELGLHRIHAMCEPANIASTRVLQKIGMKREGHLREHQWAKGRWRDSLLYAILDHEWQATKGDQHRLIQVSSSLLLPTADIEYLEFDRRQKFL